MLDYGWTRETRRGLGYRIFGSGPSHIEQRKVYESEIGKRVSVERGLKRKALHAEMKSVRAAKSCTVASAAKDTDSVKTGEKIAVRLSTQF